MLDHGFSMRVRALTVSFLTGVIRPAARAVRLLDVDGFRWPKGGNLDFSCIESSLWALQRKYSRHVKISPLPLTPL